MYISELGEKVLLSMKDSVLLAACYEAWKPSSLGLGWMASIPSAELGWVWKHSTEVGWVQIHSVEVG